jgi:hypothetical protein
MDKFQRQVDFEDQAFPISEAQKLLGDISRAHLYNLAKSGRLTITKLGSRSVVTGRAIRRCLFQSEGQ